MLAGSYGRSRDRGSDQDAPPVDCWGHRGKIGGDQCHFDQFIAAGETQPGQNADGRPEEG